MNLEEKIFRAVRAKPQILFSEILRGFSNTSSRDIINAVNALAVNALIEGGRIVRDLKEGKGYFVKKETLSE